MTGWPGGGAGKASQVQRAGVCVVRTCVVRSHGAVGPWLDSCVGHGGRSHSQVQVAG